MSCFQSWTTCLLRYLDREVETVLFSDYIEKYLLKMYQIFEDLELLHNEIILWDYMRQYVFFGINLYCINYT
jgi:hypothetical protein